MLVKHPDRVGRPRRQERLNRIVQFQMPIAAFGIARVRTDIRVTRLFRRPARDAQP